LASKPADVKRLWGRAGARCAICRSELSAVGSEGTIGEMAHIVARSEDGPRGQSPLSPSERDSYFNLVLLCPTHHVQVDNDVATFAVERLLQIKSEHEGWVQRMLEAGQIRPTELDTSGFTQGRVQRLQQLPNQAWSFASLTPLTLVQDAVDPLQGNSAAVIRAHRFPIYLSAPLGVFPNPYRIEPNSAGLVAEDFFHAGEGVAYSIECHRTGHIESAVLLNEALGRGTPEQLFALNLRRPEGFSEHRKEACERILEYYALSDILTSQLQLLLDLWEHAALPFRDMSLTVALTGIRRVCLLVSQRGRGAWVGRPSDEEAFSFTEVVSKGPTLQDLAKTPLRRIANTFGMELTEAFDSSGELVAPILLRSSPR
jgi:hypothetical protein